MRRLEAERQERIDKMLAEMKDGKSFPQGMLQAMNEPVKVDETPSPADLATRSRMAEWTLDGPKVPRRGPGSIRIDQP